MGNSTFTNHQRGIFATLCTESVRILGFCALVAGELAHLALVHWEFPGLILWFTAMILAADAGWIVDGVWLLPLVFILSGRGLCNFWRKR